MTTGNSSNDDFKRAMVVTAHPDDAEYGCSGSVAKWTRMGWEVVYVLCTDGSNGTEDRDVLKSRSLPAKLLALRRLSSSGTQTDIWSQL